MTLVMGAAITDSEVSDDAVVLVVRSRTMNPFNLMSDAATARPSTRKSGGVISFQMSNNLFVWSLSSMACG